VTDLPDTRYAKTDDGAYIAYQVVGDGPLELAFLSLGSSHVELAWELPALSGVFHRLASFSRLIRFDPRGSGLSDPFNLAELPSLEQQAADMLAVLDAAGSERAAVVANGNSGFLAIFFAATYPKRSAALVLDGCTARLARAADYPWGWPKEVLDRALTRVGQGEGRAESIRPVAPNATRDPEFQAQWARYSRSMNSPATARANAEMLVFADVRSALSAVQAPTLVLYRSGDRYTGKPHATYPQSTSRGPSLSRFRAKTT
jgi:pimeloyl-ACP methyl ester carboxylesterase